MNKNGNHWGLIHINLISKTIGFNDGLKKKPEDDVITVLHALLQIMTDLLPEDQNLKSRSWPRPPLSCIRFGMPAQPKDISKPRVNSCGLAVIMVAEDMINLNSDQIAANSLPQFSWLYLDSKIHRAQLFKKNNAAN